MTGRLVLSNMTTTVMALASVVVVVCGGGGSNHIYDAADHLKPLVRMEEDLLKIAHTYIKDQKRKLAELEPFADSVREMMELSEQSKERYLGHPINCYLMIKRFTSGWKEMPPRLEVWACYTSSTSMFLFVCVFVYECV